MGRDNFRWMKPAILVACLSMLWATLTAQITGYPNRIDVWSTLSLSAGVIAFVGMCRFWMYVYRLSKAGVPNPISQIRSDFRAGMMDFVPPLIGLVAICIFLSSMTYLKSMIVAVVPFWADQPLAAIDGALFIDPQQIALAIQPALPAIGIFYAAWHTIHLGGILWVLLWRDPGKARFIISFMLTWAIGMICAYIVSSAGPIFTGQYDPSVAPESVRRIADFLWTNYRESGARLGGGISAFPSMHVALAAWFALVLRERGLGWVGVAYTLGIFASSIILGWHYAMDSVAGIALALLAHRLAGQWLDRRNTYASAAVAAAAVPN
jgi:PAP2 superfamily